MRGSTVLDLGFFYRDTEIQVIKSGPNRRP